MKATDGRSKFVLQRNIPEHVYGEVRYGEEQVCICEEKPDEGVNVHQDWASADKDARFTLQAAFGRKNPTLVRQHAAHP